MAVPLFWLCMQATENCVCNGYTVLYKHAKEAFMGFAKFNFKNPCCK